MKTTNNHTETSLNAHTNEYWIDCGETCHMEAKEDFYRSINAGFRGFILYQSGKTFWINN